MSICSSWPVGSWLIELVIDRELWISSSLGASPRLLRRGDEKRHSHRRMTSSSHIHGALVWCAVCDLPFIVNHSRWSGVERETQTPESVNNKYDSQLNTKTMDEFKG